VNTSPNSNLGTSDDFLTTLESSAPTTFAQRVNTLLELGVSVVPLQVKSKNPCTVHAALDGTTDSDTIDCWIAEYPADSNCGACAFYDGCWFIDDDMGTMAATYKTATGQDLPQTFTVKTSRGFHYYFRHDDASRAVRYGGKDNAKIDIPGYKGEARCNHEYVVGPGSVHPSGIVYEIFNDAPIVPAPAHLLEWLQTAYSLSETLKGKITKAQSNRKSAPGFNKLCDAVGWKPLISRLNAHADERFHNPTLRPGELMYCPMPGHYKPTDKDVVFSSTPFGVIKDAAVLYCFGCGYSGDVVSAVYALDGGKKKYKNIYDCARAICKEENLKFEEFFPANLTEAPAQQTAETFVESGPNPTQTTSAVTNSLKLNLVALSDVEEEIQTWLWLNRIPKDSLSNLSGDSDRGKSLVLYDILARISSGADMPDGAPNPFGGQPKKVILLFSEGSLKTTVKPRMRVMKANMANVLALKSVSCKGETDPNKRLFSLEQDLNRLRQTLQENPDVVLIGFDPITNYLGDKCDMNKSQHVRRVLTPLGELAEDSMVTIIAIIHFNKARDMSAMHRTGGGAAWVEVPRAAWCCLPDDDLEHKGEFIFAPIKNNLGKRVGGLRYRIEETFIDIQGQRASEPLLIWGDVTEKSSRLNMPEG
jgi:hypothetical protein